MATNKIIIEIIPMVDGDPIKEDVVIDPSPLLQTIIRNIGRMSDHEGTTPLLPYYRKGIETSTLNEYGFITLTSDWTLGHKKP